MVKLRPRAEKSHVHLDTPGPSPVPFHGWAPCGSSLCVLGGEEGLAGGTGSVGRSAALTPSLPRCCSCARREG